MKLLLTGLIALCAVAMEIARFEARPVNRNYLGVGTMSAAGGSSVLNDAYYERGDWTDSNNTGTDAGVKNLASSYPATPGVNYAPWETGHSGIIKLTSGTASGQNAQLQRNFGYGVATAVDLSKVTRLIYRAVIKVDSLFTSYAGGGEHSWGVLSQGTPLCGAMFSIAPHTPANPLKLGSKMPATRLRPGAISLSNSNHLPSISGHRRGR